MPYHLFVSISPCGSLLGRHGKTVIDMCFPDSCVIFDSSLCFSVRYWNHASVALIGFSGWHLIEFCFAGRYLSPETWRWHGVGDAMVWKDVVQHPFFVDGQKLLKWTVISEAQSRVFFQFSAGLDSHTAEKSLQVLLEIPFGRFIAGRPLQRFLCNACAWHVASSWGVLTSIGNHLAEPQDFGFVFYEQYISSKQKRHMEWP